MCAMCFVSFADSNFFEHEGKPYCREDYAKHFAQGKITLHMHTQPIHMHANSHAFGVLSTVLDLLRFIRR